MIGLGIFTLDKQTATGAAPGNRIGNHQPGPGVPTRYGEVFGLAKEVRMRFNKRQLEGFAKIVDNLATASVVAAIVGGIVDHKVGVFEIVVLSMFAVALAAIGAYLRKGERDD